jgi:acyl-CoA synthetase (AMP-forming)/AMP-acid ligase II
MDAFQGRSVGLYCRESASIAAHCLLLDGSASRITLLPSGLSPSEVAHIATHSGVEVLISDRPDSHETGIRLASTCLDIDTRGIEAKNLPLAIPTEWILPTSGTTRTPKLVAHSLDTLARTVKRGQVAGETLRWGLLYDLNRFAGVQVYLQAVLGGGSLLIPHASYSLGETLGFFKDGGCNALSATPTLWRKILMTPGAGDLPLRHITLGGEIADQSILSALATAYPDARIRHIYASTEAGVGFSVSDGREGFPASYLHSTSQGVALRIGSGGILEIKPAVGGQHYLGEDVKLYTDDGYVTTGDKVHQEGERIYFMGRDSGAINVGGNKVQPEKIEKVLLSHPGVGLAAVGAKKSGITGSLVEARVVLRHGQAQSPATIAEIRDWCSTRLERHEVPALIRVVDDLSLTASGKITRS